MPVVQLINLSQPFGALALAQSTEDSRSIGVSAIMYDLRIPHGQVQQHLDRIVEHLSPILPRALDIRCGANLAFLQSDFAQESPDCPLRIS